MAKVTVEGELCKGCGYCVNYCPQKILSLGKSTNAKGYNYTVQENADKCTACKICAVVCPEGAIEVYK